MSHIYFDWFRCLIWSTRDYFHQEKFCYFEKSYVFFFHSKIPSKSISKSQTNVFSSKFYTFQGSVFLHASKFDFKYMFVKSTLKTAQMYAIQSKLHFKCGCIQLKHPNLCSIVNGCCFRLSKLFFSLLHTK